MGYVPVQRDAGQIMYQGAMQRARTLGQTARDITDFLYQKEEENKAFGAKLKSLESLLQTHSDKFGMKEDQLKQFLAVDPNESPKQRYLRIGGFVEDTMKVAQLEKANLANRAAQEKLNREKQLSEFYKTMQADQTGATGVQGSPSQLQRGTGEMSLMAASRDALQQPRQQQPMAGAQSFEFSLPPSSQMAQPAVPSEEKPAKRRFTRVDAAPAEAAPAATAPQPSVQKPAEEQYDVPPPPVPEWFKESQGGLGTDLNLSPEAKAIAAKLRQEYEASQPTEEGREPRRYISATQDTAPTKKKSITLDAEGIKAILSNPKILLESFADVAGDVYQQGLRRERLDRIMRQEEQLRALQQMMRPARRGR